MRRHNPNGGLHVETVDAMDFSADAFGWIQTKAIDYGLEWLLAHSDDGVLWGTMDAATLVTSRGAAKGSPAAKDLSPQLRSSTVQQARLFGPKAELLLWRDGDGTFLARLSEDRAAETGETPPAGTLDEYLMLWGTKPFTNDLQPGFTLMTDGANGLRHILPLVVKTEDCVGADKNRSYRPLRLQVRHYLETDETGFVRIVASRLVDLLIAPDMKRI